MANRRFRVVASVQTADATVVVTRNVSVPYTNGEPVEATAARVQADTTKDPRTFISGAVDEVLPEIDISVGVLT